MYDTLVYSTIMADPTISKEQKQCETDCKKYTDEHIATVKKVWEDIKLRYDCMDRIYSELLDKDQQQKECFISGVDQQILHHDMSKYSVDEWEFYRRNFNPVNDEEKENNRADFEKAWEHHYTNNLHHWNWWALHNKQDKMSLNFVIEMCCDWIAMSIKFGGDALTWYKSQKNIILGNHQKKFVEEFLSIYYSK